MVHISQFYNCSKIETGSELYLVCEIGRYLKNHGIELSLDGVLLSKQLVKSKFWKYYSYSLSNNYILNEPVRVDMPLYPEMDIDLSEFYTTDLSAEENKPVFLQQTEDLWLWTVAGNSIQDTIVNTKLLNGTFRSQGYVSLVAMTMVHRLLHGYPHKLRLEFNHDTTDQKASVSDIYILRDSTNALAGWFDVTVPNETQVLYETWVYENLDMQYAKFNPTLSEKVKYFDEMGYKVGSVVNLYTRNSKQRLSPYKDVENCVIAIIESVTDTQIIFKCVHTTKTRLGVKKQIEDYSDDVKKMYTGGTSKSPHIACESFHRLDIGLDRQTSLEEKFILPPNLDDTVKLWVERDIDGKHEEHLVDLDAKNGIFWILKDRGVSFNEENYRELYFKGCEPLYDKYMRGETI